MIKMLSKRGLFDSRRKFGRTGLNRPKGLIKCQEWEAVEIILAELIELIYNCDIDANVVSDKLYIKLYRLFWIM